MKSNVKSAPDSHDLPGPVVEISRLVDGTGIVGFTVTTADGHIRNYLEHFDASSRENAREKINKLHLLCENSLKGHTA